MFDDVVLGYERIYRKHVIDSGGDLFTIGFNNRWMHHMEP